MTLDKPPGRIITFYSYKGGTGRTMALANVAWLMAALGKRVLAIDWDLEAPGLHRYYHPFLADPDLTDSPGLMDFLLEFVVGARRKPNETDPKWFEPYANLLPYSLPLQWKFGSKTATGAPDEGLLDIVPAGRQDGSYSTKVALFDWQGFYDRLGGGVLLEAVKRRLRAQYDYILIDSRTGLSDTSGICSVQMPDDLVCCFTLNSQSIQGASAVAESAFRQRLKPSGEPGLKVWPVPTRVELAQRDKLNMARGFSRRAFQKYLSHMPRDLRERYFHSVEILYDSFYAYEETLAVVADRPDQNGTMLSSMIRLTGWLTGLDTTQIQERALIPEKERQVALEKFTRKEARQITLYIANDTTKEDAERLQRLVSIMPRWYIDAVFSVSEFVQKVGINATALQGALDARRLYDLLARRFIVTLRADLRDSYTRAFGVNLKGGAITEADAIMVLVDSRWAETPPAVSDAIQFELAWALDKDVPVLLVQLPSSPAPRLRQLPDKLRALSSRGVHTIFAEDFEGSVEGIAAAVEDAVNQPQQSPPQVSDDPQKGRWGGEPERHGRRLTGAVRPVSDDWFHVRLWVESTMTDRPLTGEVAFHLHPSFPQQVVTASAVSGVAQIELQCWGAFTVGAVADDGGTLLELDLSVPENFPQTFRER